jgi:hypothetical protein
VPGSNYLVFVGLSSSSEQNVEMKMVVLEGKKFWKTIQREKELPVFLVVMGLQSDSSLP